MEKLGSVVKGRILLCFSLSRFGQNVRFAEEGFAARQEPQSWQERLGKFITMRPAWRRLARPGAW
jgi:hypothetical protein